MSRSLFAGLVVAAVQSLAALAAQTHPVTGRVLGAATREPIPYAVVSFVGSAQVVQASERGEFRIAVPVAPVTLTARSFGYKRGEVRIGAEDSTAEFLLQPDVLGLEAVVVTGQATTLENRNAATYVPTVSGARLTDVPAASPEQALQGKVPGARINMNSGAPGGGGQIQIRGVTTVLGNGEPLYVVDGVIISNAQIQSGANTVTSAGGRGNIATNQDNGTNRLADLNPADIESIQVLEGAAASAMYGSRATNGVVIIATRRGQAGEPRFTLTQRVGVYDAVRLPGGRHFPNEQAAVTAARAAGVDSTRAVQLVDSLYAVTPDPFYDYQAELYGNRAPSYETQVTGRGGSDNARFFLSAGTKHDEGTMLNTGAQRDALRLNADFHPSARMTLEVGASIVHSTANRGLSNNDNTYTSPMYAFGYTPSIIDLNHRDALGNFPENPFPAGGGHSASNPFQTMTYLKNGEDVWRQIGSATLKWQALQTGPNRLELSVVGGVDRFNQDNQVYSPNFLQYEGADGFFGRAVQGNANSRQINSSLNAVWTLSPGAFTATTSAGVQYEEQDQNEYRLQARGIIPGVPIVAQGTQASFQRRSLIRDQALYGQEQVLALGERLLFSAGFRADRSSANGDRQRWFLYPKGAGSYRFLAPLAGVDELKVRAAVGQSGNRPQYGFRDVTLLDIGRIGGIEGVGVPGTIGNPNVEPERMTEQEYGVDATLFGERLAFEGTYFDRTITRLLLQAPLAPASGFGQQIINGGELRSHGWELGLTANVARSSGGINDLVRVTFYTVDQMVVSLPVPSFVVGSSGFGTAFGRSRIAEGVSPTAIWGNAPIGVGGAVRDTIIGEATPDFEMQFSNDLTWKALSLSVLVDWRKGGDVSDLTNNLFDEGQNSRDYDAPSPDPAVGATLGAYRYNKWNGGRDARVYVQDGSFVKLREVSLSCTLPPAWVKRLFGSSVQSARVTLSGRNLLTWSHYWGSDPEVNNFGNQTVSRFVDLAPYPANRSLFFSLDVGF